MNDGPLSIESLQAAQDWEGSAAELAKQASRLLDESAAEGNERLVRDYVSRNIVRKPEHKGRRAVFGAYQLLQFLAARVLLKEGWPLAKIGEFVGLAGQGDLLSIVEPHIDLATARATIRLLGEQKQPRPGVDTYPGASAMKGSDRADQPSYTIRAAETLGRGEELRVIRGKLGVADGEVSVVRVTRVPIARGLLVEVEHGRLCQMTDEDATTIGRAVALTLMEAARSFDRRKSQ